MPEKAMAIFGRRYVSFRDWLASRYAYRLQKISFDIGSSCPNRDGSKARGGCIFCAENGSASRNSKNQQSLYSQYCRGLGYYKKRKATDQYIAYLQAFTPTYAPIDYLRTVIEQILRFPYIGALAISTRPDCLSEAFIQAVLPLIGQRLFLLELGLQSSHEKSLQWMNRQDDTASFSRAVQLCQLYQIPVVSHIILGIPGESLEDMLHTIDFLNQHKVHGIKFHQLHAIPGSRLWEKYQRGQLQSFTLDQYASLLIRLLEYTHPETIIHRLVAEYNRHTMIFDHQKTELTKEKVVHYIELQMQQHDYFQGRMLPS